MKTCCQSWWQPIISASAARETVPYCSNSGRRFPDVSDSDPHKFWFLPIVNRTLNEPDNDARTMSSNEFLPSEINALPDKASLKIADNRQDYSERRNDDRRNCSEVDRIN